MSECLSMQVCKGCQARLHHLLNCLPLCQFAACLCYLLFQVALKAQHSAAVARVVRLLLCGTAAAAGALMVGEPYLIHDTVQNAEGSRVLKSSPRQVQVRMLDTTAPQNQLLLGVQFFN